MLSDCYDLFWCFGPWEVAEQRCGFDPEAGLKDKAKGVALFFDKLLDKRFDSAIRDMQFRVRNQSRAIRDGNKVNELNLFRYD